MFGMLRSEHLLCMKATLLTINNWNDNKAANPVTRLGTTSSAAELSGVHRMTVIRHIDTLEADLDLIEAARVAE